MIGCANIVGIRDIEDTLPLAGIEWEIDRAQAATLGVNVVTLAKWYSANGMMIGEYRPDDADKELEIVFAIPLNTEHCSHWIPKGKYL